jgi:hypothetical protein
MPVGGSVDSHQHLTEAWHARVMSARKKYDLAVSLTRIASQDFRTRQLPTPDGGSNLVGALRTESRARDEYMRVLRIFSDLVLRGEIPKE